MTIKTSRKVVKKSRRIQLSGSVTTAGLSGLSTSSVSERTPTALASTSKVVVQRLVHNKWKRIKTCAVSTSGRYSVKVRPAARGTYRYRAVLVGTGAKSRSVRIKVR